MAVTVMCQPAVSSRVSSADADLVCCGALTQANPICIIHQDRNTLIDSNKQRQNE